VQELEPQTRLEWYGRFLFIAAIGCVTAFAAWIVRKPVPSLLEFVPDDAFYYLQIARHLAASGAPTFDGINPTNGYHPAWLVLITACARLVSTPEALLTASLVLAFSLHICGSLVMAFVLRHLTNRFWGWIGGTFWLLNPLPLLLAAQGVEASLYMLTLQLAILVYVTRVAPHIHSGHTFHGSANNLIGFGASLSIAFLARTDASILAIVGLLWIAAIIAWLGPRGMSLLPVTRTVGLVGGTFLIGILPWFLYSVHTVGSIAQNSSGMKMLWAAERLGRLGMRERIAFVQELLLEQWFRLPFDWMFDLGAVPKGRAILLAMMVAMAVRLWVKSAPVGVLAQVSVWLILTSIATGCAYGFLLGNIRFWYLGLPGFAMFLVVFGISVANLIHSRYARSVVAHGVLGSGFVIAGLLLGLRLWLNMPVFYPWQPDVYSSQVRFESLVRSEGLIGSFNAGIPAYFSGRTIVNLDGLVNDTVYRHWQARTFERYLYEQGITHIIDEQEALARARRFISSELTLTPITSAPLTGWRSNQRWLWRVETPEGYQGARSPRQHGSNPQQ
jgi:hypothetical protein